MNVIPLINGSTYDYVHITMTILGVPVEGVKSINYTEEQAKENNYGTGKEPVSRGQGEKIYAGSLELPMEEVEKIRSASPTGSLTDIDRFDIVVAFIVTSKTAIHTIKNVEFLGDGVETTSGDTQISRTFDIIHSGIKYA